MVRRDLTCPEQDERIRTDSAIRRPILPNNIAAGRHLEQPPLWTGTDQRVAVLQPFSSRNVDRVKGTRVRIGPYGLRGSKRTRGGNRIPALRIDRRGKIIHPRGGAGLPRRPVGENPGGFTSRPASLN